MNRKQLMVDSYKDIVDGSTCKPLTRKPATSNHPAFALLLLAGTLLLLALALAFLPQPALAATPITTYTELQNIRNNLGGSYYLANDIDCTGFGSFEPIGNLDSRFTGNFDGNGYKITHLYMNRPYTGDYLGLFGCTGLGSEIKNVSLEEVDVRGKDSVGGLVGYNDGGRITNSYSSGFVKGHSYVGGLVGQNGGPITNSYSSGSVSCSLWVGGLVGYNEGGTITNSYSTGYVSCSGYNAGGLVGLKFGGRITNCYWDIYRSGRSNCVGYDIFGATTCTGKNSDYSEPDYWYYSTHAPMDN